MRSSRLQLVLATLAPAAGFLAEYLKTQDLELSGKLGSKYQTLWLLIQYTQV